MGASRNIYSSGSRSEKRRKKKAAGMTMFYRILAVILIVAGLGVLGYTGYERLMVSQRQQQLREEYERTAGFRNLFEEPPEVIEITEWQPMMLIIPAIDLELAAVGGGDVFDESLLDQGPTHFNDLTDRGIPSAGDLPNTREGNVSFAGHRAGRWNFFLDINKLEEGDEIYLDAMEDGYRFIYEVEWVEVFDKYDWDPIRSTDYPAITLQTCEPPHVSNPDYRLMARGKLVDVITIPVEAPEVN